MRPVRSARVAPPAPIAGRLGCLAGLGVLVVVGRCGYDPPPEVQLALPAGGAFESGAPLVLEFSEPIRPESLALRVWPAARDIEGELPADVAPLVPRCAAPAAPCGDLAIAVAADGTGATLQLAAAGLGRPDRPLLLEVLPGLADAAGNDTGQSAWFDILFVPATPPPDTPPPVTAVPFEQGTYIIVGSLSDPLPAVLTYITDVRTLPDGRVALAGAEGDEIGGAPKNTTDPEHLVVDEGPEGYTVYALGQLTESDGTRFLQTEPFAIGIVTNGIHVDLAGVRIHATVVAGAEHDGLEGTFSYEAVTLHVGELEHTYPGGSTGLVGVFAPPEVTPAGGPEVCGDLCGVVVGICEPPEGFPPADFCVAAEPSGASDRAAE